MYVIWAVVGKLLPSKIGIYNSLLRSTAAGKMTLSMLKFPGRLGVEIRSTIDG